MNDVSDQTMLLKLHLFHHVWYAA